MVDAVVVGSGPNGLAAAVVLAERGRSVRVLEASSEIGGGCRTAELTLPGFRHDVCAAVHPLGAGSPVFRSLPLDEHGLIWLEPPLPLAHPFDDGTAAVLARSVEETATGLGPDTRAWLRLLEPFTRRIEDVLDLALAPPLRAMGSPLLGARFGAVALQPASRIVRRFRSDAARGLFAGLAAHAIAPLGTPGTAGVALVLAAAADLLGWPVAHGGSQAVVSSLAGLLSDLGGTIETGVTVRSLDDLPDARAVLLATDAHQAAAIGGQALHARARRALRRVRPSPGGFKLDFALDGPIPWTADVCRAAGTVHVGGSYEEIAAAEAATAAGEHPDRPFVLVAQPSLADHTRAPAGKHVGWAYCHVPYGSGADMTGAIFRQIERFAPGFAGTVLAANAMGPADFESYNRNYRGGDITGGAIGLRGLLFRPAASLDPYRIGERVWLCSAATPPGAGVHGMCGYHAARSVMAATR
jgi:phytoene dehydrogenase-like protein